MFNIHASDADEHQFFQQVFADDPNADLAELAASQSSSVLKNTHLQRISNRKKQVHNPDLEDFKIDLVDEKVKEEDETSAQYLKSANTILSQNADYDMFTEVPPSDDRRIKTGGFRVTNANHMFDHKSTKSGKRDFLAESLAESKNMFKNLEENPIFTAMESGSFQLIQA